MTDVFQWGHRDRGALKERLNELRRRSKAAKQSKTVIYEENKWM